jgi:peptidoglycan/LPS O-acetylase OafA/YrhL
VYIYCSVVYTCRRKRRRRLLLLAALALAYAAVAALMWFDWRIKQPRPLDAREERVKLAAQILASALVGGSPSHHRMAMAEWDSPLSRLRL